MKVVHNSLKDAGTAHEWLEKAKALEDDERLEDAAGAYRKVVGINPLNELAYHRLMVIYRKLKEPGKELSIIKKAIRAFEGLYDQPAKSKKVGNLSRSLMKATGLADKKGRSLYQPEPLGRWLKRQKIAEKKAGR